MDVIAEKLFIYLVIIFSATFHEYMHGLMAYKLGDRTAKDMGRLTLNPLAHIDLIGTVVVPLFLLLTSGAFIGWAKPVPYNPYNLKDQKYGSLKVGAAGPAANFSIALAFGLFLRLTSLGIIPIYIFSPLFFQTLSFVVYVNIFLGLFNLIPFPPLDGSKILMDLWPQSRYFLMQIGFLGIFLALFLAMYILSPLARVLFWIITGQGIR